MRPNDKQLDWIQAEWLARTQRPRPGVNVPPKAANLVEDFRRRFRKRVSAQWIAAIVRQHFRGWRSERNKSLLTWAQGRYVIETYRRASLTETAIETNRRFGLKVEKKSLRWWLSERGITTAGQRTGRFEPGDKPVNKVVAIGEERVFTHRGKKTVFVQTGRRNPYSGYDGFMMRKCVVVWEAANGPTPKGHAIVQIDGDWRNCEPDNLELVTRAELARLNQMRWSALPRDRAVRMAAIHTARLKQRAFDLEPSAGHLWRQSKANCVLNS